MNGNERLRKNFLESKAGTSPATQKHYRNKLDIFLNYCKKKKISIENMKQDTLVSFLAEVYKHYKPKTANHIKSVLVAFIKTTYPTDWLKKFPSLSVICRGQRVEEKYSAQDMLSVEEVEKIIKAEYEPFWKCVYSLQFYGGCRPNEICSLKWTSVTFGDDGIYFKIFSKKNNKYFEKFVPEQFSYYLRELQKTSTSEYCFSKKNGNPIRRNSLYVRLVRTAKKVFPNKKINPYLLRHSFATIIYGKAEKGELSDSVAARQMGHSKSMKGTYTHLNLKTLRENARKIFIKPEYTPEEKDELEKLKKRVESVETAKKELQEASRELREYLKAAQKKAIPLS